MGKSNKLIKSLILGAKAFSKEKSGDKKEQSTKLRAQWSQRKSYFCGYDPDDDTEDQLDFKSNEQIDNVASEGQFASAVMNSGLQSETSVANPTHKDSEDELSDTVVKPDKRDVLAQEEGASVSRTNVQVSMEEYAATVIQAAVRGFLCRRAFAALKSAIRFQDLSDGQILKKQTAMDSRCMQALIKVQAHIRARQVQMSEEGQAVWQQIQQKRQLRACNAKSQDDWDHSLATFDQIQAKMQNKQDAAMRRERALAYAFAQQLRICGQKKDQHTVGDGVHPDQQPHLGWTWLERWMAARSSDNNADPEKDTKKNHNYYDLDNNQHDTLITPQYGKIQKKKAIDKQPKLSPTKSLPYNNSMKSPSQAKSILPRTSAKSSTSSSHESANNFGDLESGTTTYHHMGPRKQLFFGDDVNQVEESCGSNAVCSSPEIRAKGDTASTERGSHNPKLHKSSGYGPTKLKTPNYMSTTQSSTAKVHNHSNDPTKPRQPLTTTKSTPDLVSTSVFIT